MQISKPNPVRNSGSNWGGQTASAYEVVVSTLHNPVLILKKDLVIESANAAFAQAFRINIEEAVGCRLYELRNGQWNFPSLRAVIHQAEKQNTTIPALIDAIISSPQFTMRRARES